ncbi:MAG: energy transducer TonB [Gammaproteobacteria bacterium]
MLFVAVLFHAIIILGVRFTVSQPNGAADDAMAVEVVLLTRDYEKRPDVNDAEYIAQQNLVGSGNTSEDELRVAYGRNAEPVAPGQERDGASENNPQTTGATQSDEILFAHNPNAAVTSSNDKDPNKVAAPLRTGMPGTANTIEILASPDTQTVLRSASPRELVISANTSESRIAAYLDSWKRRVERVGTINFPWSLLDEPRKRDPVLQVSIAANGKLSEVIILSSSGNRKLDMAAVDILKRSSPFDAFPEYLRNDYDSLKFSYEWRFSGQSVGRMKVP